MQWIVFRSVIVRSSVAGKAVCIHSSISLKRGATMISRLGINLIDALIHIQVFCWLNFGVHGPMIKISSHFIPVFILLGDLIISLSLFADWWTKNWILWLFFWVLSFSVKNLTTPSKNMHWRNFDFYHKLGLLFFFFTYNYLNKCPHWTNYQK